MYHTDADMKLLELIHEQSEIVDGILKTIDTITEICIAQGKEIAKLNDIIDSMQKKLGS